ncbi:MAG TPA: pyrimidine 5'-nucleotidase [Caulobacteraceae bacterium]|nr:pyrimidine 5'-nucleotidase [Caulobacteraceae bacterium]
MSAGGGQPGPAPDLGHVGTWLFDLDNTLYPLDSGLGHDIDKRLTDYVIEVTGLPRDEAYALQKRYLAEHGLTLKGLIRHHDVDPEIFHRIFHDLPLERLSHDPALKAALARLPGRRLIFTNADARHAERVAERLGLTDLFDDIFDINLAGLEPKPSPRAFERIIEAHAIDPAETAFFEDAERNLEPAAALGMTTVLVGPHAAASTAPFVHHRTERLAPFLAGARLKEAP